MNMDVLKFSKRAKPAYMVFNKLRVGMKILTNGTHGGVSVVDRLLSGVIGEVSGRFVYVWSNNPLFNGFAGHISPSTRKYKYSWLINLPDSSSDGHTIEILDEKMALDMHWNEVYS